MNSPRCTTSAIRPCGGRRSSQRGFTLVEVLVALLLFSLGLLGLVAMQAKATRQAVDAEDRTRAALLADDLIATMWTERSSTVSDPALQAWAARLQDAKAGGLPGNPGYAIETKSGITTVTLTWTESSRVAADAKAITSRYATSVVIP
jgi:type IV pilus assembly protein PilV